MKKYLLAILALGATMMMACNPDDKGGNIPEPPKADYTLSTDVVEVYLENYGDMYEVGLNDFNLTLGAVVIDEAAGTANIKMLMMEFMGELSNKTGVGSYTPAEINWYTGEGLKANTYLKAAEIEGEIVGCGYIEMDMMTENINAYEGIADGTLTISKDGDNYVVKGTFTTLSGKVLKVDYTGAVDFEDYSDQGGAAPLSVKNSSYTKHFSSAVKFLKK